MNNMIVPSIYPHSHASGPDSLKKKVGKSRNEVIALIHFQIMLPK